jgi:lipase chaperone LimK
VNRLPSGHAPATQAVPRRRGLRLGAWLALAVLILVWLWRTVAPEPVVADRRPVAEQAWGGGGNPFGQSAGEAAATQPKPESRATTPTPDLLSLQSSSLSGTQADGDWSVDAQGRLVPHHSLRRRFDYYLTLIGERDLAGISAHVQQEARAQLSPEAATAVMNLWARYVGLQQHTWKTRVDPLEPATWPQALQERRTVRRERLGAAWAEAFYGQEERTLEQTLASINSGQPLPAEPSIQAPPHPEAPQRLAQQEADWARWERRLASAREQIATLQSAPHLSPLQRQQAIEQLLNEQFEAGERARVRALLKL